MAFAVIFLILFLFIFFLVNITRGSSRKKKAAAGAPAVVTRHQGGLLAAASRLSSPSGIDEISSHDVIYEKNGVPYINSDLIKKSNQGKLNNNFIELVESVTGSLTPPIP